MKKPPESQIMLRAAIAALMIAGCTQSVRAQEPKPATPPANDASMQGATKAPTDITDAEIRDVISRVAKHQIRKLADGAYPAATTLEEAKMAKEPEGIQWAYPWGVTLY